MVSKDTPYVLFVAEIIYLEIDTAGLFTTSSTSVTDIMGITNFSAYPNPANDFITLAISLERTEKVTITIKNYNFTKISREHL